MSDGNRGKKKKVHVVLHRWAGRSFTSRHAGVCVCVARKQLMLQKLFFTPGGGSVTRSAFLVLPILSHGYVIVQQ